MKKYTLGLYEKALPIELSWEEKLKIAKESGYDFIEISIDETDVKLSRLDWTREQRLELIKKMYQEDIAIGTMCLSGHRRYPLGSKDPELSQKAMEIMKKAIILAVDLGIRIIQLAGYDVYYEDSTDETKQRFLENLHQATKLAAKAGVILAFETMETQFMNTVAKAMSYVEQINSPYLGVYPDCGNLNNAAIDSGTDVYEDIKRGKGHIVAMHLKETVPGKFRDMMYGTGDVDFNQMIKTAWNQGVRKYVTEFWYLGSKTWREDIVLARTKMAEILDKQ